ncbi:MAG: hypothetical protein KC933_30720 [Myxococcales bacterium]|nr:hypothetical protein [Myxococcales bacterium]MCB9647406.1 hypothetical protein [Deltaproteobacteria bacterium]
MSDGMIAKKPVVLLLENYILDRIGALNQADEITTQVLVEKAFGERKDWRGRLQEEFGLTPALDAQLKAMWKQAQGLAQQKGSSVSPREFAEVLVEENFADLVHMVDASLE